MKTKSFSLMDLYNKDVLGNSAFRLYRLFLDIHNEAGKPTKIKASRQTLMRLLGLSENALKACLDELILLQIIELKSERPAIWKINSREQFNETELTKRVLAMRGETAENQVETSQTEG